MVYSGFELGIRTWDSNLGFELGAKRLTGNVDHYLSMLIVSPFLSFNPP